MAHPWWKETGRTEDSHKPEELQQLCDTRTLQDGKAPCPTRPNPARVLDDQVGLKGCITPGPNLRSTNVSSNPTGSRRYTNLCTTHLG